ncbi:helix-turn-helix transcriptional regulator [Flavobacterium sp. DG1-102-2]|uniref:helix-turn-helix domain-containing protein n=1 Tax=Flavobacterium sp. DG1-102-2 TaxID=3081663 RepID=UPI00294A8457|nr:helix-turn-helix transcriptional regulator [Flavobacterium sp. DG1-102-2]MDV6167893.1 helix-turn-helix transcriptional regulator [Flavobacterium sp. DG1-102-2]
MENHIGLNINFLKVKNKLTLETFGELFDLTKARLNTYTSGRSNPPVEKIQEICAYFKISIDDFINKDMSADGYSTNPKIVSNVEEPKVGYNDDKTMVIEAQKETIESLREQISLLKDKVSMLETTKARAS